MGTTLKTSRAVGSILSNLAVATVGTAIAETGLERFIDRHTLYGMNYYPLVTGGVAFALGLGVYLR